MGSLVRRLSAADLADFQAYRSDAGLGIYQGWLPMADADALAFLERMAAGPALRPGEWAQLGIALPENDVLVGDIGVRLEVDQREAEIGFTLSRTHQRRGIATQAVREAIRLIFEQTPVERVIAITDARNAPSIELLDRLGMTRMVSIDALFRGEPCVEHTYVLRR